MPIIETDPKIKTKFEKRSSKIDTSPNSQCPLDHETKVKNETKIVTCHHCKREGHKVATCRYRKREEKAKQLRQEKQKLRTETNFKKFIADQLKAVTKRVEINEDIIAQITHTVHEDISSLLKQNTNLILKQFATMLFPFQKFAHNEEDSSPNQHGENSIKHLTQDNNPNETQKDFNEHQAQLQMPIQHRHQSRRFPEGDGGGGDGAVTQNSPQPSSPEEHSDQAGEHFEHNDQPKVRPHQQQDAQQQEDNYHDYFENDKQHHHYNHDEECPEQDEEHPSQHYNHNEKSEDEENPQLEAHYHQQKENFENEEHFKLYNHEENYEDEEQLDYHNHHEENSQDKKNEDATLCIYCNKKGHVIDYCELRIQHLEEKVIKLEKKNKEYKMAEFKVYQNHKGKKVIGIEFKNAIMFVDAKLSKIDMETSSKIRKKKQFLKQYKEIDKKNILLHREVISNLLDDHSRRGEKN